MEVLNINGTPTSFVKINKGKEMEKFYDETNNVLLLVETRKGNCYAENTIATLDAAAKEYLFDMINNSSSFAIFIYRLEDTQDSRYIIVHDQKIDQLSKAAPYFIRDRILRVANFGRYPRTGFLEFKDGNTNKLLLH